MMQTEEMGTSSPGDQVEEKTEEDVNDGKEESEKSCDEEKDGDDVEKKVETPPTTGDEGSGGKKPPDVLNLNNEVVNMRKEVKRVRGLIVRKLIRQITALKKKKGNDNEVERNQRRVLRLVEEIHCMKKLSPDLVTKTALQKTLSFEKVCKNPECSMSDRAVARIATHPQFNKKIENIKAAVSAFKQERVKGLKQDVKTKKVQKQAENQTLPLQEKKGKTEKNKKVSQEAAGEKDGLDVCKESKEMPVVEPEIELEEAAPSASVDSHVPEQNKAESTCVKSSGGQDAVKNKAQNNAAEKISSQKKVEDDESDLEPSDEEEKEYFDDSTEERFRKQSSQSELSDDEDDFFMGKVSKFKKKKTKTIQKEMKEEGEKVPEDCTKTSGKLQKELDELESRLKSKATSLQSVFCSSLTRTRTGKNSGRGRGGAKFMDQSKQKDGSGLNRDFDKQAKFPNKKQGASNFGSKYNKSCLDDTGHQFDKKHVGFAARGRGRGGGDVGRGRGRLVHAPQPALHPSWEASKKRKEQQGQIMAFQGKKIKFDDD